MTPAFDARLVRSWLFCPATRPERLPKAETSGADAVVVDWEDAVAPADKDRARAAALPFLCSPATGARRCLRPNALRTADGLRDLLALLDAGAVPDAIVPAKTESAEELRILDAVLGGPHARIRFLPLIETARGLAAAAEIAAHPRVAGLVLGGADLAADLGAELAWEPLLWSRSRLVQAAAVAGIAVVDVPCLAFDDDAALAAETRRVRALGFTGKLAIHPRQVAIVNAAFTPDPAEVVQARRIVEAAAAAAGGVAVVDGRMVDAPVVRAAERVLALARRP
jgi:citrate lyase beta subunit